MTNPYSEALKKAQKDLAECDSAADKLECQRAKLRQTIAILQAQLGIEAPQEKSLTEAILMTIKANPGYIRAADVARQLQELNYPAPYPSVATILARLAKRGQITHAIGPDSSTGYAWKTELTRQQRNETMRELAQKGGTGKER